MHNSRASNTPISIVWQGTEEKKWEEQEEDWVSVKGGGTTLGEGKGEKEEVNRTKIRLQ